MATKSQLAVIRAYIKKQGPTAVAAETGISRRALSYIVKGQTTPFRLTFERLWEVSQRAKERA